MFLSHIRGHVVQNELLNKKNICNCIDAIRHIEIIGFRSRPRYDGEHDRFSYHLRRTLDCLRENQVPLIFLENEDS